jgi:protein-tyrosine-phosphatase
LSYEGQGKEDPCENVKFTLFLNILSEHGIKVTELSSKELKEQNLQKRRAIFMCGRERAENIL